MAVFQWVGGYTAHTGFMSGYSGNYKGSGKAVWMSVFNGLTGMSGDRSFAPHYWGFKENWRERVPAPSDQTQWEYDYIPATRLPRGGDKVVFGSVYNEIRGAAFAEQLSASISLLFGGLSGGEWHEATSGKTSDIEFEVHPHFGGRSRVTDKYTNAENYYGGVGLGDYHWYWSTGSQSETQGKIWYQMHRGSIGFDASQVSGQAAYGYGAVIGEQAFNFTLTGDKNDGNYLVETSNYIDPLDIRFSVFNNRSTRAKIRIKQVSANGADSIAQLVNSYYTTPLDAPDPQTPSMNPAMGTTSNTSLLSICGRVGNIEQDNGTLKSLRYKSVGLSADNIYIRQRPVGLYLDESTTIYSSVVAEPNKALSTLSIHCGAPYLNTTHRLNYQGYAPGGPPGNNSVAFGASIEGVTFAVGNRYGGIDGYSCTFGRWDTETVGGVTNAANEPTPRVFMYNLEATTFYGKGGYLKTAADPFTGFPVFRDGYLRSNTVIDLSRQGDPTFRSGMVGKSAEDEGLRMDSYDARIIFAQGQNFLIDSKGDPQGIT
jgi:hypothetical protein